MHARPPPRAQRLITRRLVALVPVHALPAGLLAEHRAVLRVPSISAGHPQRATGSALVPRIADVVVGLVNLAGARQRVGGGAVMRAKAADVHLPHVERWLPLDDPLRHHPADPARAGQTVGAEAGGHEQTADLGLPEAELVV